MPMKTLQDVDFLNLKIIRLSDGYSFCTANIIVC